MARPSAADRLHRILAIVPWIAERGTVSVDELCERFAVTEEVLRRDLEVVPMVGLHPYTPDTLVELIVDGDDVTLAYGNYFERPLRLTREEALGIIAAGQAAAQAPGHDDGGPLARGLAKLADVVGVDLDDDLAVVLEGDPGGTRATIAAAVEHRRVLHLGYWSHARAEHTERDVEPLRLHHLEGAWYLDAHCRSTDALRVFRVDRITDVSETGDTFDPDARTDRTGGRDGVRAFDAGADLPRATLELAPEGAWVAEQFPVESRDDVGDGRVRVTLAVSARPWLDRVLLQLGPHGRLVGVTNDPDGVLDGAGVDAARRLLARYA